MKTYISILRGINVSGKNIIKMEALKEMYTDLGFRKVTTYIQSGNVIFQSSQPDAMLVSDLITSGIVSRFALKVPVLVLHYNEFQAVLSNNPFLETSGVDISKLHITFLSGIPGLTNVEALKNTSCLPDEFVLSERAVYLMCPDGYGNTKLTNSYFENKLKVTATTRNVRTSNELLRIAGLTDTDEG